MINFQEGILEKLVSICQRALPKKAYGIIAGRSSDRAEELYPLQTNLRPLDPEIKAMFEAYGEFYCDQDRGFWVEGDELFTVTRQIEEKGQQIVAIYHSHRCRRAAPSQVDIDLHYDPHVLAVIVSLADPHSPEVRAFKIGRDSYQEVNINGDSPKESVLEVNPLKNEALTPTSNCRLHLW